MRKITAFFLALAMVLSLAACVGNAEESTDGSRPDSGASTGPDSAQSQQLRQQLPASDTVDLDSGKWIGKGDYGVLIIAGNAEDNFFEYMESVSLAGYCEGEMTETSYALIQDYENPDGELSIRVICHYPSDSMIIAIGRELPEDADILKLVESGDSGQTEPSGSAGDGSELRALIPHISLEDSCRAEWVENNGYGALVITGVEGNFYEVFDTVMDELRVAGYTTGSGYGWGNAQITDFRNIETKQSLRGGYNPETGILVMISGMLPTRYTCWKLLGKTADELGEPTFEDSVYDYMPEDATSCIYKYYADRFSVKDKLTGYQLCDVSLTRLEKFIGELTALGYTRTIREENDNSVYYVAKIKAYQDVDVYVTAQLAWTDGKLAMAFSAPDSLLEKDDLMEKAATYTGTATGRDPNAPPDEGYQALQLSAATRTESVNGATIYYFEGGYPVESARLYIDALKQQGYRDEQMPYVPDVKPYEVEYAHNWLVNESMGDQSWVIVVACSKMAVVITSAQQPTYREHDLWDMVGYAMRFGIGYLETMYMEFCNTYGVLGIDGESRDSNGYFANYGTGCTLENVNWMIGQLESAGFTSYGTTTENGAEIWIYTRTDSYELLSARIYARILLKDGFGEIEFGYSARNHSENMQ